MERDQSKLVEDLYAEIDTLRRRVRYLEANRDHCGVKQHLQPECRIWLVMSDMLKAKHRIRRDGR